MIVVFGSINVDVAARVDALPRRGETVVGRDLAVSPGGKGANQALAARRAGARVELAGAVGRDAFAGGALALLREEAVGLEHVRSVDVPTGTALIHVDAAGDNAITVVAGANAHASAAQVPDALLAAATTLLLQLEAPAAESLSLARRAKSLGRRVMLNAAPATTLDAGWMGALDVLVVNAIEAASLAAAFGAPADPIAFAADLARRGPVETVVVTLGAAGAFAASGGRGCRVPALAVDVVDTVGAGDAFAGTLAAAFDRGDPLATGLAAASAAGGLACTRPGAQGSLPRADAIAALAPRIESRITVERI